MHKSFMSCDITWIHFISRGESVEKSEHLSYHDLFSKDIGLMEFVEWKKEEDAFLIISWKWRDRDVWYHNGEYQYMIMWPMTAEEKIRYFLDNVIIPTP